MYDVEWPETDICTPLTVRVDGSKIQIISAGKTAREKYGYGYGAQVLEMPQNCVKALMEGEQALMEGEQALMEGEQLAIDILDEYVLFLYVENGSVH